VPTLLGGSRLGEAKHEPPISCGLKEEEEGEEEEKKGEFQEIARVPKRATARSFARTSLYDAGVVRPLLRLLSGLLRLRKAAETGHGLARRIEYEPA
jgi:hypothetical protein